MRPRPLVFDWSSVEDLSRVNGDPSDNDGTLRSDDVIPSGVNDTPSIGAQYGSTFGGDDIAAEVNTRKNEEHAEEDTISISAKATL